MIQKEALTNDGASFGTENSMKAMPRSGLLEMIGGENNALYPIEFIELGRRHRNDLGDIRSLADSIRRRGFINAVTITHEGVLLCGLRRLMAAKRLGLTEVPVRVIRVSKIRQRIHLEKDENTLRKDLNPSEVVALCEELSRIEREELGLNVPCETESLGPISPAIVSDVARALGKNKKTIDKAIEIVHAAKNEPEKYADLTGKMDGRGSICKTHKELQFRRLEEKIKNSPPEMASGKYGTIVVDPPWEYSNNRKPEGLGGALPYPTMSLEDIFSLRVSDLAAPDCILCLWTTNAHLPYAFIAVNGWGFEYPNNPDMGEEQDRDGHMASRPD